MSNKCNVMTCVALGASLLAAAGCAADGGEPPSDPSAAIAKVDLPNGMTVSFREPTPGAIAIEQLMPDSVSAIDVSGMTAVGLFQSIAPGQTVPAPLAAAQRRADAAHTARGRSLAMTGGPSSRPDLQITSAEFATRYCLNQPGWAFVNCHAEPFPTTGLHGVHDDIDALETDICVNSGKVRLAVSADGEPQYGLDVPEHFCLVRGYDSGWSNADSVTVDTTIETAPANYGLAVKWNH